MNQAPQAGFVIGAVLVAQHLDLLNNLVKAQEEEERRSRAGRTPRSCWVRPWRGPEKRRLMGWYETLMVELEREDHRAFKGMMRMDPDMFHELETRLTPRLQKRDTNCRKALSPGMKLAVTLKFLATGCEMGTLMEGFRVARNTCCVIIRQVCDAIFDELHDEVLKTPRTPEEWKEVALKFGRRWNFWHALGALDGKHVAIQKPPKSGSDYYNYKGFFSIVLLALVDADYRFLWVQVGDPGACSDAQLYNGCQLKRKLDDNTLAVPPDEPLPNDDRPMPYFLIGDNAFALKKTMMKPYGRRHLTRECRIFNYRCSRARRVVENAFGILACRFRCLLTTICKRPDNCRAIVMACIVLHNLMRARYPGMQNNMLDREDEDHNLIPGAWRQGPQLEDMQQPRPGNNPTQEAMHQRDDLRAYYNSPAGAVHWQDRMVI